MKITYDLEKNAKNVLERGLPFNLVAHFNWNTATFREDQRKNYLEQRIVAVGYLENRLHVLCFSETDLGIRVISFRKANKREEKSYEQEIAINQL
jgi:uncharacterized DUF497 family protein